MGLWLANESGRMPKKDASKEQGQNVKAKMKDLFAKNKPTPAAEKPIHEDHLPKGTIKIPVIGEISVGTDNQHRYQTACVFVPSLYCMLRTISIYILL